MMNVYVTYFQSSLVAADSKLSINKEIRDYFSGAILDAECLIYLDT